MQKNEECWNLHIPYKHTSIKIKYLSTEKWHSRPYKKMHTRPPPDTGATVNWEKMGVGEAIIPREMPTNWLSRVKWSSLKSCIQVT